MKLDVWGGARFLVTGVILSPVFLTLIDSNLAWSKENSHANYALHVTVMRIHEGDFSTKLSVTGFVTAAENRNLAFRVGGTVTERNIQTGDLVHDGDVLARLGTGELEANITAATANVAAAKASLDLANSDMQRQKSLLDKGFATRSAYEQSAKSADVATAALKIAQSQLQVARDNLSYAELKASADGVVTAVNMEVGQVVQAGQTVLTLAIGEKRQAVFDVSEAILNNAAMGKARIFLAADPSVTARAVIAEVSPTVDRKTGTVRIKADLIDPPAAMSLGAAVTGEGQSKPVHGYRLPYTALSRFDGKPAVWVVNTDDGKVEPRTIELLDYSGSNMIVSGDLKDGAAVVTQGTSFLSPGLVVSFAEKSP